MEIARIREVEGIKSQWNSTREQFVGISAASVYLFKGQRSLSYEIGR